MTGDGEMMMGLGSLAVVGAERPRLAAREAGCAAPGVAVRGARFGRPARLSIAERVAIERAAEIDAVPHDAAH